MLLITKLQQLAQGVEGIPQDVSQWTQTHYVKLAREQADAVAELLLDDSTELLAALQGVDQDFFLRVALKSVDEIMILQLIGSFGKSYLQMSSRRLIKSTHLHFIYILFKSLI